MPNVIVGYENHPAIGLYQDCANPTIANTHPAPGLWLHFQNTANKVADEIAMADQNLVLVFPTSALEVPVKGFFGLFFALSNLLSRDLSKVLDICRYGWYTRVTFPQSPRPLQRNVRKLSGNDLCRLGCSSQGTTIDGTDGK
jgi:hypothetical protein